MKKLVLVLLFLSFITLPAFAEGHGKKIVIVKNTSILENYNDYGAKLDAPKVIRLTENWYVGAEAMKNFNQTDVNDGYSAYIKATYEGTLFDLRKKEVTK